MNNIIKLFINKWNWRVCDYDWYYWYQCTDLIRQYCTEVFWANYKPYWNAWTLFTQDWGNDYIKYINTPDFLPHEWDICIWSWPTKYWHIGVVSSATLNNITILDQNSGNWNWDGIWNNKIRVHVYNYKNIIWFIRHKSLIPKEEHMKQFWTNVTTNWLTYPWSVYWVEVRLTSEDFDRTWLLKLHWVNTKRKTYILLHPSTVRKWKNKVREVLMHEFAHVIYHTILKTNIFEKIDTTDMELTKFEYWDFISRNIKEYITKYASTHSAEDFAECIWYGYYIENNLQLPKKASMNTRIKTKYIIANNLYKRGLKTYLEKKSS